MNSSRSTIFAEEFSHLDRSIASTLHEDQLSSRNSFDENGYTLVFMEEEEDERLPAFFDLNKVHHELADHCMLCTKKFKTLSMGARRHHCRLCGKSTC